MYIECIEMSEAQNEVMSSDKENELQAPAQVRMSVVNQLDPDAVPKVTKYFGHDYTPVSTDWGYSDMVKLDSLPGPENDHNESVMKDDKIVFLIEMWWDESLIPPDSKKDTGYVGLDNQGATCYMNSLLQSLFHLQALRNAVYKMPTQDIEKAIMPGNNSVSLALQRVFYLLQNDKKSVQTKELTTAFGWDSMETFTQHDVQELLRLLLDNLEEKMKKTEVEGRIAELFKGELENYIACVNVDFQSTRKEDFYDLSLNVKGCDDIYSSLDKYIEVEMMDGDNQYQAEGHGMQDAKMGKRFLSLPPFLQLHLKRFEYDFNTNRMVKVNDRFEFYDILDLSKYVQEVEGEEDGKKMTHKYHLHSVLIHGGDVHAGHYYAFIKPKQENQWYKFDDEHVTKVEPVPENTFETVEERQGAHNMGDKPLPEWLENCFGGFTLSEKRNMRGERIKRPKRSSGYMLVYVREDHLEEALGELNEFTAPEHLRLRHEADLKAKLDAERERREAHLYCTVQLVTMEDIQDCNDLNLVEWKHKAAHTKVLKASNIHQWVTTLEGAPLDFRVFLAHSRRFERSNEFYKSPCLKTLDEEMSFSDMGERNILRLVVLPAPEMIINRPGNTVMDLSPIFVKTVENRPRKASEAPLCSTALEWINLNFPIDKTSLHTRMSVGEGLCFQIQPYLTEWINSLEKMSTTTLKDLPVTSGQIIYSVSPYTDEDSPNPVEDYLCSMLVRIHDYDKQEAFFEVELLRTDVYAECCKKIIKKGTLMGLDMGDTTLESHTLLLYEHDQYHDRPETQHAMSEIETWTMGLAAKRAHAKHCTLYFKVLNMTVAQFDNSMPVKIEWQTARGVLLTESDQELRVSLESSCGEARDHFIMNDADLPYNKSKQASSDDEVEDSLPRVPSTRMFTVSKKRRQIERSKILENNPAKIAVPEDTILVLEEITEEEKALDLEHGQSGRRVKCAHVWAAETDNILFEHGRPFILPIWEGETIADVEARLHMRFEVADEELAGWTLILYDPMKGNAVKDVTHDAEILKYLDFPCMIGLKHKGDPKKKRKNMMTNYFTSSDRQMKIRG